MRRRRILRTAHQVAVTATGTDATGKPFIQRAVTVNVSSRGVHLAGIHSLAAVGDAVELCYRRHHALYKVAWIGAPGGWLDGHAGLENVHGGERMFADMLPPPEVEAAGGDRRAPADSHAREERRRSPHVPLRDVQVVIEGYSEKASGVAPNLSVHGMFVNTRQVIPRGALLRLRFRLSDTGDVIEATGEVRYRLEGVGVGIEFVGLTPEMRRRIQQELDIIVLRHGMLAPAAGGM